MVTTLIKKYCLIACKKMTIMRKNLLFCVLAVTIIFSSCKKDNPPEYPDPVSVNTYFTNAFQNEVQVFEIGDNGRVKGKHLTKVYFYPNAFVNSQGDTVQGSIKIEMVEILKAHTMVFCNAQTVGIDDGEERILVSGGQVWLRATQNGQPLTLVPGRASVGFYADNPDPSMRVFYGQRNAEGNLLWTPDDSTTVTISMDTVNNGGVWEDALYYSFPASHLGWINLDYFWDYSGNTTVVKAKVPQGYNIFNTKLMIVLPSINSMANVTSFTFPELFSTVYSLPVGAEIVFAALHLGSSGYTSAVVRTSIHDNHLEVLQFSPTTTSQFETDVYNAVWP